MTKLRFASEWLMLADHQQEELKAEGQLLFHTARFSWYKIQRFYVKEERGDDGKIKCHSITELPTSMQEEILPMIQLKHLL